MDLLFAKLEKERPDHFAVKQYRKFKMAAGKTLKSILISCGARLSPFDIQELRDLMAEDGLELDTLGDRKSALFVILSDTDSTFNFVAALMYSQLFNLLCDKADDFYGGRLPVHVRCLLDEFANIGQIPNFDKLIATIRSREISASIILQSQSQLPTATTTLPPYGYMKSSDDKKQWVKDEEAAQVVYEIGLYIMDGLGPSQIARKLTERKILTPAAYYASKGRTTNVTKKGSPYVWDSSTIADIMDRWREYLGHTVNFKTRKKSYKSKKTLLNPESEWKIFENTHEAIWTEAIADAARLARQTRRRPTKMGEMGMFSGMMFCADCGSIMYQCRATNFRRDQEYYLCSGYRKSRDVCGQTHSIRTVILEELVLQNLREIVSFASQRKDDFVKMVMDADMRQRNRGLAKRKKTLADAEKRIAELDTIFKRLYEDTISGKLSDERFQKLSADYEKEQHQLQEVVATLRDEIEAEERKSANVERFLSVVERYTEIPELTPCILHEFVEKIVVHAASDPKGKNRTQEIDIYYKGIGALEVSKVTSSRQE